MFLRALRRSGCPSRISRLNLPKLRCWADRKGPRMDTHAQGPHARRSAIPPHARPKPGNSIQVLRRFPPLSLELLTAPNESECRFLESRRTRSRSRGSDQHSIRRLSAPVLRDPVTAATAASCLDGVRDSTLIIAAIIRPAAHDGRSSHVTIALQSQISNSARSCAAPIHPMQNRRAADRFHATPNGCIHEDGILLSRERTRDAS
jgi:hypothetical protein